MPVGSLTFLAPWSALVVLAAVVPLAALAAIERRAHAASRALGLEPSGRRSAVVRAVLILTACGLVAAAAAQPVWRTSTAQPARNDAQAFFVVDVSRSMLASDRPGGQTRLERATAAAQRLRSTIGPVPAGAAGMTDRVLPYVFPTSDESAFASALASSVEIEAPPPANVSRVATTFDALGALGTGGFFTPAATRRVCVVVTDGESGPFSPATVAAALARGPGCRLLLVRVGSASERIWRQDGRPEAAYRPSATASGDLARLAQASGARVFASNRIGAASRELSALVGAGSTAEVEQFVHVSRLGPWLALAALLPLAVLIAAELVTRPLQEETRMFYDHRLS